MANIAQGTNQKYSYDDFIGNIDNFAGQYHQDINETSAFGFPTSAIISAENALLSSKIESIAYFSMEYGLTPSIYNIFKQNFPGNNQNIIPGFSVFSNQKTQNAFEFKTNILLDIPIYGGGLGVLAGDTIKTAADLGLSVVGVGILWNKGYFKQKLSLTEGQISEERMWDPSTYPGLIPLNKIIKVPTREGELHLRLWKYYVYSYDQKSCCPIILLDSDLEENSEHFRKLTDQLYRSDDSWWKIFQRSILGIGGMKALGELGYKIDSYHLNEGHAAFAFIEMYIELDDKEKMEEIKKKFVFTCHTPVAAGHDRFLVWDLGKVLGDDYVAAAKLFGNGDPEHDDVNLTYMALNNCRKVNAVAQKHGEVMHLQFPDHKHKISAITNGVHIHTWISESFRDLYESQSETLGSWRSNPEILRNAENLKDDAEFRKGVFEAHQENKRKLCEELQMWGLKEDVLTMGWARRITGYKRPTLLFTDTQRIVEMARQFGPIQIIIAGKSHPNDDIGRSHIESILKTIEELKSHEDVVKIIMIENYNTYLGKLLTNSCDVWLNNPIPPFEASGTSGMKAALNGVVQCSTLDGWIVEAANENIGWIFGYQHNGPEIGDENNWHLDEDSAALYETLEDITRFYYKTYKDGQLNINSEWIDKMINCIKISGYFSSHRMVKQYKKEMWT